MSQLTTLTTACYDLLVHMGGCTIVKTMDSCCKCYSVWESCNHGLYMGKMFDM